MCDGGFFVGYVVDNFKEILLVFVFYDLIMGFDVYGVDILYVLMVEGMLKLFVFEKCVVVVF